MRLLGRWRLQVALAFSVPERLHLFSKRPTVKIGEWEEGNRGEGEESHRYTVPGAVPVDVGRHRPEKRFDLLEPNRLDAERRTGRPCCCSGVELVLEREVVRVAFAEAVRG